MKISVPVSPSSRSALNADSHRPPGATRERILGAAEHLFMDHGFEATSLRMITAEASVNLAAVNYHFGSKERLVEEVFHRRLSGLNAERLRTLDALEAKAGGAPLPPEKIIEAFFGAALRMNQDVEHGGRTFIRLLGRAYTEPARSIRDHLAREYAEVLRRFRSALVRSLPHLPTDELAWRMHFMFGTMSYTIAGTDPLQLIASCEPKQVEDADTIMRRIVAFLVAGLTAPLPNLVPHAKKRSVRTVNAERRVA